MSRTLCVAKVRAKDRMLEAGTAAPSDRDALEDRLRDGTF